MAVTIHLYQRVWLNIFVIHYYRMWVEWPWQCYSTVKKIQLLSVPKTFIVCYLRATSELTLPISDFFQQYFMLLVVPLIGAISPDLQDRCPTHWLPHQLTHSQPSVESWKCGDIDSSYPIFGIQHSSSSIRRSGSFFCEYSVVHFPLYNSQ